MTRQTGHRMCTFVGLSVFGAAAWYLANAAYVPLKAVLAQHLLERAWTRSIAGHSAPTPWPWADTFPLARLRAPRQNVDLIVLSGATGRTLAFGPGYLAGSAPPGGPGRAVIAAHRDTHFSFLESTAVGDPLEIALPDGRNLQFVVSSIEIVNSRRASIDLDAPGGALMLVTCYPFGAARAGGPLRYQVLAEQVSL